MDRNIPFISSSIMNNFLNCKYSFLKFFENDGFNSYRQDNENGEPIYLQFGTIIHSVIEQFWKSNTRTKKFLIDTFEKEIVSSGFNDSGYITCGYDIFEYFFDYLKYKTPKRKMLHSELSFNVNILGVPLHGTIDAIFYHGDGIYEIEDYKTSNYVKTREEVDEDIQLSMYDYVFNNNAMKEYWFNGIKPKGIILTLHFVKHGKIVQTERTKYSRVMFGNFIKLIYKQMCTLPDNKMKPNLNKFCTYCDICSECPLYNNIIDDNYKPVDGDTIKDNIRLYNEYSNMAKILQKEADYYYSEVKEYLSNEPTPVEYDGYLYFVGQNGKRYINKDKLIPLLKDNGLFDKEFEKQHISIPLGVVDKIIKENPQLEDDINDCIGYSYYQPSLMTQKAPKLFK